MSIGVGLCMKRATTRGIYCVVCFRLSIELASPSNVHVLIFRHYFITMSCSRTSPLLLTTYLNVLRLKLWASLNRFCPSKIICFVVPLNYAAGQSDLPSTIISFSFVQRPSLSDPLKMKGSQPMATNSNRNDLLLRNKNADADNFI